jgi:hypothetical protein
MWLVLPGSAIVVKLTVLVAVFPSVPVAVTFAVYFVAYFSACAGTHDDPSGLGSPSTEFPDPALVSSTLALFAFFVWYVISTAAGTSVAASFGPVMVTVTLPPSSVLLLPPPFQWVLDDFPQADRARAAISTRAAAFRCELGAEGRMVPSCLRNPWVVLRESG